MRCIVCVCVCVCVRVCVRVCMRVCMRVCVYSHTTQWNLFTSVIIIYIYIYIYIVFVVMYIVTNCDLGDMFVCHRRDAMQLGHIRKRQ